MQERPFELLPETVEIGGKAVRIDWDFRFGIAFECELLSDRPDYARLILDFYPDGIPQDVQAAVDRLFWFYRCGRPLEEGRGESKPSPRGYDFRVDAEALLASFRTAYGIDLDTAHLHWWTFRRLMFGLPRDTPFMERVHYRVADVSGLSKRERKHYQKMRALYALDAGTQTQKTAAQRDAARRERLLARYNKMKGGQQNVG